MELLAVGTRHMTIFKFGLYSIGFYLETEGIKLLRASECPTVSEALSLIISRRFEWSLRLVPLRNGSMGHLRDALVRRLKQAAETEAGASTDTINAFSSMFPNTPLVRAEELFLHWNSRGGLLFMRAGQQLGRHGPLWTSQQLLHIYLDPAQSTVPQVALSVHNHSLTCI